MKQYQAILLDLDNTLYPYHSTHQAAMESLYQAFMTHCGIARDVAEKAFANARHHVNTQLHGTAASHNRLLYIQNMCEQLQLNTAAYGLLMYDVYWDTFLDKIELYPFAQSFLEAWLALDKRICLVTDLTAHIQHRKVRRLGLENTLHSIVTSEEVGHEKPHPNMFMTALKKLDLDKNQVVMIGDSMEKDVQGAQAVGIHALCFAPLADKEQTVNFERLLRML